MVGLLVGLVVGILLPNLLVRIVRPRLLGMTVLTSALLVDVFLKFLTRLLKVLFRLGLARVLGVTGRLNLLLVQAGLLHLTAPLQLPRRRVVVHLVVVCVTLLV